MKPPSLLRIAALVVVIIIAVIGMAWKSGRPAETAPVFSEKASSTTVAASAVIPPPVSPVRPAEAVPPADNGFAPGHFPGVSVRHEPGTHRPTPAAGTPRSQPVEHDVMLPDGRRLKAVTLDESWRVPLTEEKP